MYQNKNVAGLWIDHEHAFLISTKDKNFDGEYDVMEKFKAPHHGIHTSSENAHHHKINQELHQFFKQMIPHLAGYDVILLTGPGKAQEELNNYIKHEGILRNVQIEMSTADTHLTHNQILAKVRGHFHKA